MAPTSYQAPMKGDHDDKQTHSQTAESALRAAGDKATVGTILKEKGGEVISIAPDASIGEASTMMRDRKIGAILVRNADNDMVGILSERDIVRQLADTPGQTLAKSVADLMTTDLQTCITTERLDEILQRMTDGRFRHMPVVEAGALLGMISIGDVVKYRLLELEYEALKMKQMIVG